MERPYLSLSAVSAPDDLRTVDALMSQRQLELPASHDLLMGISANRATVHGQDVPLSRKLSSIQEARQISDEIGLPMELAIHFECYHQHPSEAFDVLDYARLRTAPFAADLLRLVDGVRQDALRALQLNGVIDPEELRIIHEARPDLRIIYQLRRELVDRGEADIVRHLQACRFGIHHILIDLSAGLGVPLDPSVRSQLLQLVRQTIPEARIGIAGGLSVRNVRAAYEGAHAESGMAVSLDTETAIRDVQDRFDPVKGVDFLAAASAAVREAARL